MAEDVIVGRYRLLEQLGKGAMAAVWLAEDSELERRVAVKVLWPEADRERFGREARAVAALAHTNVCRLYDFGETDDGPFMVLEYLPGGSLEDRLAPGHRLADGETRRIASEIASGLAHAHEHGLVHRDLKPGNILFDDEGRAKIADFGIVRQTDTSALTEAGTVLGTAAYISPEQTHGERATSASDVYSFGVILFQMLTGRLPFESSSAIELAQRHRTEPAPPVSEYRADAPDELAALANQALAKDPRTRPADGAALVSALEGQAAVPVSATAAAEGATTLVVSPGRARRRTLRNVLLATAVAVLALAGLAVAFISTRGGSGSSGTVPLPSLSSSTAETTTEASVPSTTAGTSSGEQTTSTEITLPTVPTATKPRTTTAPTTVETTTPITTEPTTTEPPPTTEPATTGPGPTTTTGTVTP